MELRQLRYAVAVAEDLHFGRAADRLHVAQPSLSRQIRDLERSLDVRIFDRTSRTVVLTAAGEAFIEMARRTIRMADAASDTARAAASGWTGRVALGFVTSAAGEILPPLVSSQRRIRPAVLLDLRELNSWQQVEALRRGEIDLGIPRDVAPADDLTVTPLFHERLVVAVSDAHPLATSDTVGLDDLSGFDFVGLPRLSAPRTWSLLSGLAFTSPSPFPFAQEARQFTTVLALVAAELGIAIVPHSVKSLRREGIRYLHLREPEAYSEVQVARRSKESQISVLQFHDLTVETLKSVELTGTQGTG